MGDHPHIKQKYHVRYSAVMDEINKLMDKLIGHKLVEPSNSAWSSPVIMARKSNGTQLTWTRPFGLTNAPTTFQRLINKVIGPELEPHAFAYLDDVVIVSETFEDHLKFLKEVLDRLVAAGLSVDPEKCLIFRSETKYLGFPINNEGVKVDPSKLAPILDLPAPRNIRKLQSFLGSAGWYRRFIPNFATVAEPLFRLLKKAQPFDWQAVQEAAFQAIKTALTTAPVVARPDFAHPFTL